jgi:hypothetical protein
VRFYVQFFQASALDLAHPDNLAIQTLADAFGIRPQYAIDHPREILPMGDVIDLRALWRDGHKLSF